MGSLATAPKSRFFYRWHGVIDRWFVACRKEKGLPPPETDHAAHDHDVYYTTDTTEYPDDDDVLRIVTTDPECKEAESFMSRALRSPE